MSSKNYIHSQIPTATLLQPYFPYLSSVRAAVFFLGYIVILCVMAGERHL